MGHLAVELKPPNPINSTILNLLLLSKVTCIFCQYSTSVTQKRLLMAIMSLGTACIAKKKPKLVGLLEEDQRACR